MPLVTQGSDFSQGDLSPEQKAMIITMMNKWMEALVELSSGGQRTLAVNIAAFYMHRNNAPIEEFMHDVEMALEEQK